jgi:hypothetical protein
MEACRDVDAVAEQVAVAPDHVADRDAAPGKLPVAGCRQKSRGAAGFRPSDRRDGVSVRTLDIPAQGSRARSSPDEASG